MRTAPIQGDGARSSRTRQASLRSGACAPRERLAADEVALVQLDGEAEPGLVRRLVGVMSAPQTR